MIHMYGYTHNSFKGYINDELFKEGVPKKQLIVFISYYSFKSYFYHFLFW